MKKILLIVYISGSYFASAQNIDKPWLKPIPVKLPPDGQIQIIVNCMLPTGYKAVFKFDPATPKLVLVPAMPYEDKNIFLLPPVIHFISWCDLPNARIEIEKQILPLSPQKFKELQDYLSGRRD